VQLSDGSIVDFDLFWQNRRHDFAPPNFDQLNSEQLRASAAQLLSQVDIMGRKIHRDQALIEKLTFEIVQLKRLKFANRSEQMNPEQANLLDDLVNADIAAIEAEL